MSTEKAVVSDKHREDYCDRRDPKTDFLPSCLSAMVPMVCLECNPSSSLNQESKANVKAYADSSSLELPNEWWLLLPATGTKASLSTARKHNPTFQICRAASSSPGRYRSNQWEDPGGTCALIKVAQSSKKPS